MKNSFICSGCGRDVQQFCIKNHISNCQRYDAFYLSKIKKLNQQDDINELKFLSEEFALAREYLQSIISKQKRKSQEDDLDIFEINPKNKMTIQNPKPHHQKSYKSDFYIEPQIPDYKKNSFSFNQFSDAKVKPFYGDMNKKEEHFNQEKMKMQEEIIPIKPGKKDMMIQEEDEIIEYDNPQIVQCPLCKNKFYSTFNINKLEYIQQCWHLVCKKCLKKYIEDQFISSDGFPKCPLRQCQNKITEQQSKIILGDKFQMLQDKAMRKMANFNIVECIKCKSQYDFAPGNPNDAPKKDDNGKPIKEQYAILYAEQRFNCTRADCKTQQCKQCKATPYHLGMDCKEYKSRALMLKCRYCISPITQKNINKNSIAALSDICNSNDCQQLAKNACSKILPCSHPCCGVKNEKKCLPCLRQGCCEKQASLNGQAGDDYCAICFVQGLIAAPSIQCGCGHIFHQKCIKKRFDIKWLTPRILFNLCLCPLCKKWIQVPPQNQLYQTIRNMKQLYALIQKMSLDRLKFEQCQKDQKLTSKDSPYYNKPKEYAMAIYAYFMCYKCQKPYFGGRKNCAEVMNNAQNVQGYDQKQLVCPKCCDIPIENCPKHGVDFIQFKCKFCCSTAQWFCWGNTHFCEPCHKKQCNGDYVSKYTKQQLPKCQGPGKCPIGGNHGLNGQQKMLGCAICRNYKQNSKNF